MQKPKHKSQFSDENFIIRWLDLLKATSPVRDQAIANKSRQEFLEKAQVFSQGVSTESKLRQRGWIFNFGKEPKRMTTLVTIVLVLSIMFGGAGATVVAAQNSIPEDALYGLKLASEDARLDLTTEQTARLWLTLSFSHRRAQEMAELGENGRGVPNSLMQRWSEQINESMRMASQLEADEFKSWLLKIQNSLHVQEQLIAQIMASGRDDPQAVRVQSRIRECLQIIDLGLVDPVQFRLMTQENYQAGPEGPFSPGEGKGPGESNENCENCTPQGPIEEGSSQNPWTEETPTPNSGYGAGDGLCEDCTPQGPLNNETKQNPWSDENIEPGSSYGPGDGDGDCEGCNSNGPSDGPGENQFGNDNSNGSASDNSSCGGDGSNSPQEPAGNGEKGGNQP